jgi:hypothetical protein
MAAMIDPKYAPFADSPENAEFLAQINAMITAQPEHRRLPFVQAAVRMLACIQAEHGVLADLDPTQRATLRTTLSRLPLDQWLRIVPTSTG